MVRDKYKAIRLGSSLKTNYSRYRPLLSLV